MSKTTLQGRDLLASRIKQHQQDIEDLYFLSIDVAELEEELLEEDSEELRSELQEMNNIAESIRDRIRARARAMKVGA